MRPSRSLPLPLVAACVVALGGGIAAPLPRAAAQVSPPRLDVVVVTQVGAVPLANARVTLQPAARVQLTSPQGIARFDGMGVGMQRVAVRRIGFQPLDTTIVVADAPVTLRVALRQVAMTLAEVQVVAYPICRKPGVPKRSTDPIMFELLEQLRLNGEQYMYMVDSLPFAFRAERVTEATYRSGRAAKLSVDTIVIRGDQTRRYRPGRVVVSSRGLDDRREQLMMLPTLDDFASKGFLENHCFHYGGVETVDGQPAVRVDFRAAQKLRTPDVHGTIWLDSAGYLIRRAELELTRVPRGLEGIAGVTVTTGFTEVAPAMPILDVVDGVTRFVVARSLGDAMVQAVERQRRLGAPVVVPRR